MKKNGIKYFLIASLAFNIFLSGIMFTGYRQFMNSNREFRSLISNLVPLEEEKHHTEMRDKRFKLIQALKEEPLDKKKVSKLFEEIEISRRKFYDVLQKNLK